MECRGRQECLPRRSLFNSYSCCRGTRLCELFFDRTIRCPSGSCVPRSPSRSSTESNARRSRPSSSRVRIVERKLGKSAGRAAGSSLIIALRTLVRRCRSDASFNPRMLAISLRLSPCNASTATDRAPRGSSETAASHASTSSFDEALACSIGACPTSRCFLRPAERASMRAVLGITPTNQAALAASVRSCRPAASAVMSAL